MNVTWYGTASIGIDDGKTKILFDPFVRMNKKLKSFTIDDFTGSDGVFITHGHFDHIYNIPELAQKDKNVKFYCTKTPCETLKKKGISADRFNVIAPGDVVEIGDFKITAYQGRHVVFDLGYMKTVFARCVVKCPLFFKYLFLNQTMPEAGEILIYKIENGGKTVLLMGSYGTDEFTEYPKNPDLFVLANGGSVSIPKLAKPFLETITPKKVFFDHFDDAFPPLTRDFDIMEIYKDYHLAHPETELIVPYVGQTVTV